MYTEVAAMYAALREHVDAFWPDRPSEEFVWSLGPMAEEFPRFRIRRIAPVDAGDVWVYVTVGAWEATADRDDGIEFVLLSPVESPRHVETLAMVAHLHSHPQHRLAIGDVMPIGHPWLEASTADHLLVALPYPFGSTLELCQVGSRLVRFLWLVPITETEADYRLEALETLLDHPDVNIVQADRSSVV